MTTANAVLTLIAPENSNLISNDLVASLKQTLTLTGNETCLADGEAVEWLLDEQDLANRTATDIVKAARAHLGDHPIDIAITPASNRRKKLLISDMDSTIIQQECIDEIAFMAGIKPKIAAITERAMRGEIEFDDALRERVGLLKDLPTAALDTVIEERINLTPGARTLVRTMAANGAHCALVSGGFTFFTDRIAKLTGFHTTQANILEIKDDKLTGRVIPPILGSEAKKLALETFLREKNMKHDDSLAVGDGANDLAMIQAAGLGIAFHAKPIVAEGAAAAITHGDLTGLLYLQGYRKDEFVSDHLT